MSEITRHPARTSPGWAIAIRSRCRRPSGCTVVPSFSACDSAGKMTVACSAQALGQHRGVGDDEGSGVHRPLPQAAVGLVADGVGPEQVQGGDLAVGGGRADLRGAAARGVSGGVAGTGVGDGAGLAQPAAVGAGGQRQHARALALGQPQAAGRRRCSAVAAAAPIRSLRR